MAADQASPKVWLVPARLYFHFHSSDLDKLARLLWAPHPLWPHAQRDDPNTNTLLLLPQLAACRGGPELSALWNWRRRSPSSKMLAKIKQSLHNWTRQRGIRLEPMSHCELVRSSFIVTNSLVRFWGSLTSLLPSFVQQYRTPTISDPLGPRLDAAHYSYRSKQQWPELNATDSTGRPFCGPLYRVDNRLFPCWESPIKRARLVANRALFACFVTFK